MPTIRLRSAGMAVCAVMASLSCGSDAGKLPVSAGLECFVSSVTVVPSATSVVVGASTSLTASVAASNCTPAPAVGWQSSAPNIASVTQAGVVTGASAGTATITATAATRTGTAVVTVTGIPVASVSVTAPSSSLAIGTTLQATAQTRDNTGNVLTGRVVTWASSSATIATVSPAGLITGITAGTATITATSEGRSGQLVVTVTRVPTASLTITSVTPAANATNVGIETPIRIQFSDAINATSVTSTTFRVTAGSATVAGTFAVSGNAVTFTPSAPLTEFNTAYTVTVTSGVLSTAGDFLAAQSASTFTTVFWDPAFYYRITNQSLGAAQALDTFSNSFQCFMGVTGNASGQFWYFVATQGGYAMKNQFQGDPRALEGADGIMPCFLTTLPPTGYFTGQTWNAVAVPQFPNTYRLQNVNTGTARSLDVAVTNNTASPRMVATANTAAQAWLFTRLGKR